MDQVLYGLKKFMKTARDMPVPADINNILNPAKPKITEAQYIQACKSQERNGFPMFSDAKLIKEEYEAQEKGARENHDIQCRKIKHLANNSVKRICYE